MRGGGAERGALSHGGAGPERAAMLSRSFTLCGVCCAQLLARFSVRGSPLPARPGGVCCGRAVGFCCVGAVGVLRLPGTLGALRAAPQRSALPCHRSGLRVSTLRNVCLCNTAGSAVLCSGCPSVKTPECFPFLPRF